jgi:protein-glutamine gamma-glutamyltransferase
VSTLRVRPRPTRHFPALVSQLSTVGCLAGLGMIAGVTWMYVAAAIIAVGLVYGIRSAARSVGHARLSLVDTPAVVLAGEAVTVSVLASCRRPVIFELRDGPCVLAVWRHRPSDAPSQIVLRFASRGVIEELDLVVRSAGPFGSWVWQRIDRITLEAPIAVGPQPIAGPPLPTAVVAGDGDGGAERPGTEPGALLGLRPWADGDPIGWVHWPSAARGGEVLVRQWQPPARTAADVELVREGDPARAEHAAGVAAGRVVAALGEQREVRLTTPSPDGGSRTTTVRDRWATAKTLAEADLPRLRVADEAVVPDERERSRTARLAVAAVVAVACATTARATGNSLTLWAVCLVALPCLTWLHLDDSKHRRRLGSVAVGILGLITAVRFFAIAGAAGAGGVFSIGGALIEVLAVLVVLRATTGSERRVLRFAIGASAALVGFSAALRFDPLFAWAISAWMVTVAAAFVALQRSRDLDTTTTLPTAATIVPVAPIERARSAGRTLATAACVVALAFVALIAVPIPQGPVRLLSPSKIPEVLKVPSDGGLAARNADGQIVESDPSNPVPSAAFGYTAFASSFDLSQRGRPGNEVVMRVRAPAPDFWRAQTFEVFDGRQWFVAAEPGVRRSGPVIAVPLRFGDSAAVPTEELVQTFMFEQDLPNLIFAAGRPSELLLDASVWIRPDGALRADTVLTKGTEYTVVSKRPQVTAETLRMQGAPDDPILGSAWSPAGGERYLQLPDTTTDRVRELTLAITDPYPNVYDKIQAIEAWLAANVAYDLGSPIPPEGQDAVDHFLFESKRGFCEQIATTLVIMLRSIGVRARVAAGYIPGERDPFGGVWVVREGDAHAWAEVWFPATGWQAFDPTAEVPFAGDTAGLRSVGFPIVAAAARFIVGLLPQILLVLIVGGLIVALTRWLRIAVRSRRDPAWAAQRRFEQICRRLQIPVDQVDTNETLADRLAEQFPHVREPAQRAANAIDAATFDVADPRNAADAVGELHLAVRSRAPARR